MRRLLELIVAGLQLKEHINSYIVRPFTKRCEKRPIADCETFLVGGKQEEKGAWQARVMRVMASWDGLDEGFEDGLGTSAHSL